MGTFYAQASVVSACGFGAVLEAERAAIQPHTGVNVMRCRTQTLISGLTMIGVLIAAACSKGDEGSAGLAPGLPCPRGNPVDVEVGAVIRIGDIEAPCRIEFHESEVVLRGDPNGERPDPGRSIVQDSRGRFYSTNASGFPSVISIWDTDGTYLSSFGAVGDGPGELSGRGGLTIFMDRLDRLHVRDGGPRWTVFGNDQSFIRSVSASAMGGMTGRTIILDDGGAELPPNLGPEFMGQLSLLLFTPKLVH